MQRGRRGDGYVFWRRQRSSARARAGKVTALAILSAMAIMASPALSGASPPPTIHPRHGRPFVPTLGDWEGTADGFPASFSLELTRRSGVPGYGFGDVAVLRPHRCPTSPAFYAEELIPASRHALLGGRGSLGLTPYGLVGSFTEAETATMSAQNHVGTCSTPLIWHMHPTHRTAVGDGVWRVRFADGESSRFRVLGGGRIATSIRLPAVLTRCNGLSGAVDLFIGAAGLAKVSQPNLRVSIQFGRHSATGRVNAGGRGCSGGPIRLTASLA